MMLYYKMLQAIKGKIVAAIINDDYYDCYIFVYDLAKLDGKNLIEDRVYDEGQLENVIDILKKYYNINRRDIKEIDKSESLFHHEYDDREIYQATINATGNILRLDPGSVQTYYMYVLDRYNGDIIKKIY